MNLKGNLTSKGLQGSIGKSRMQGILGTNPAAIPISVDNALSLSSTNPVQNRVITAAITNRLWSDEVKTALLQIVEKVAYIDNQGQTYYDALYDALYPPVGLDSISAVFDAGGATIYNTDTLDDLKQYLTVTAYYSSGDSEVVDSYTLSGSMDAGTQTITVSYGGKTTTFSVTVVAWVSSISAVFTQGQNVIYDTDTLDTLKQYLVVTANYADSTTATVSDYTLSGTLSVGTSTITASYGGKSATFTVTTSWGYKLRELFTSTGSSSVDTTKAFENGNTYTVAVEFAISSYDDRGSNNFVGCIWGDNTTNASTNYIALQENEARSGTSKGKYCWGAGIGWSSGKNIAPANNTIRIVHIITINGANDNSISASFKNVTTSGAVQTFSSAYTDDLETGHIIYIGNPSTNRGFKGTVSNFILEKRMWSNEEITSFLGAS